MWLLSGKLINLASHNLLVVWVESFDSIRNMTQLLQSVVCAWPIVVVYSSSCTPDKVHSEIFVYQKPHSLVKMNFELDCQCNGHANSSRGRV